MTTFPGIVELAILGVWDAGAPNMERVVMRAIEPIRLGQFGLTVGIRSTDANYFRPMHDNFYWFGDIVVDASDWILLYTGKGEDRLSTLQGTNQTAHVLFWGRPETVFNFAEVIPVLMRPESILMGPNSTGVPNLTQLPTLPIPTPTAISPRQTPSLPPKSSPSLPFQFPKS